MPTAPKKHMGFQVPASVREQQWESRRSEKRPLYHTKAWRELRRYVHARDMGLCQPCLREGRQTFVSLEAKRGSGELSAHCDHKDPAKTVDDVLCDESELETLCPTCHSKKTMREKGAAIRGN